MSNALHMARMIKDAMQVSFGKELEYTFSYEFAGEGRFLVRTKTNDTYQITVEEME